VGLLKLASFGGIVADHTEYLPDVKIYHPEVDEAAVKGIVRHCGIALRSRDAANVAASDKAELDRVRDSFLKKKLGLTLPDDELDAAVKEVADAMKGDRSKSRVTFYYLLAKKYDRLGDFR
jgi:uncharacterized protein DUF2853